MSRRRPWALRRHGLGRRRGFAGGDRGSYSFPVSPASPHPRAGGHPPATTANAPASAGAWRRLALRLALLVVIAASPLAAATVFMEAGGDATTGLDLWT